MTETKHSSSTKAVSGKMNVTVKPKPTKKSKPKTSK
jgi:hypothetical protein